MIRFLLATISSLSCVSAAYCATTNSNGVEVYWESSGEGPGIVLVHGLMCDTTVWVDQVAEFERDYRVIALDLPGHGRSGALSEGVYTLGTYADAIEAVRAAAGIDEIVLVGHSLGGPAIGEYWKKYPEHVAALVGVDAVFVPPPSPPQGGVQSEQPTLGSRAEMLNGMFVPSTPDAVD